MATTIAAFALVGLAVWGVPGLSAIWPLLAVVGGTISLVLLAAYWDGRLVFGMAINLALIAVAVLRPGWTDGVG